LANKDKLIASAQKFLDKGQIAKAIKDYQKIVELDSKDVRNRQKLAELYSRARMIGDALSTYEAVARYYVDGGFFLKAIAVYKQMQKLDPGQSRIYLQLAQLNEKQGLVGNALAEYRNLVDYYEKHQLSAEAIETLQKMKALDPANLNIRVKIAESLVQAGMIAEAKVEFEEILAVLRQKDDFPRIVKFYDFFLSLCPGDVDLQAGLADAFIDAGDAGQGIQLAETLLKDHPEHVALLKVEARGFCSTGDRARERQAYQQLFRIAPDDLDLKEDFISSCLAAGDARVALNELQACKESLLEAERLSSLKGFYEQLKDLLPNDPQVVEALHDLYQRTGEGDKLFDLMSATSADDDNEPSFSPGFDEPQTSGPASVEAEEETIPSGAEDNEISAEAHAFLSQFNEVMDLSAGESESSGTSEAETEHPPDAFELELELDLDMDVPAPEATSEAADGSALDLDALEFATTEPQDAPRSAAEVAEDGSGNALDLSAELEEAEFYFQQELYEEAEKICRKLLNARPDLEEARSKLAEIERRRTHGGAAAEPATEAQTHEYFDLASEIFEDATSEGPEETVVEGIDAERSRHDGAFSEFKKGVESQIGTEDAESHYNLGIAYKEMGLFDDAVAEFNRAMKHAERLIDSLTLKGICLVEKGAFPEAEGVFKSGLGYPKLSAEERVNLGYELGLLYETWGHPQEALESFQAVTSTDPFFRDVSSKIAGLRKSLGLAPEPNDEKQDAKGNKDRISYL